MVEPDRPMIL